MLEHAHAFVEILFVGNVEKARGASDRAKLKARFSEYHISSR